MKFLSLIYIGILIVAVYLIFQIQIPLCYQAEEKKPISYVIYDEDVIPEIKADIQEKPYFQIRINGESMTPAIQHNDVCICSYQPDYEINDIVSFYVPTNGKVELIAHRIIIKEDGKFRSKGDANAFADNRMITKEQIFCKIPETSLFEKFKFAIVEYGEFRIR